MESYIFPRSLALLDFLFGTFWQALPSQTPSPPKKRNNNNNSRRWNRASTTKIRVCTPATGNPCTAQLLNPPNLRLRQRSNGFPPWKNQRNHLTVPLNNKTPPPKKRLAGCHSEHGIGRVFYPSDSHGLLPKTCPETANPSPNKIPSRGTRTHIPPKRVSAGKSLTQKYLGKGICDRSQEATLIRVHRIRRPKRRTASENKTSGHQKPLLCAVQVLLASPNNNKQFQALTHPTESQPDVARFFSVPLQGLDGIPAIFFV